MSVRDRSILWQVIIMLVGLLFSALAGWLIYQAEEKNVYSALKIDTDRRAASFSRDLVANTEPLYAIATLFERGEVPSIKRFNTQAKKAISRHPDIQAIEWIPKVERSKREMYEQQHRTVFPRYKFTEHDVNKGMVSASVRDVHFPVYYVYPYQGNQQALGYDLASDPTRLQSLLSSQATGETTASASINLVQDQGQQKGFLVLVPIYNNEPNELIDYQSQLLGFVSGVYRVSDIFYNSALQENPLGIEMKVFDDTNANSKASPATLLVHHKSRLAEKVKGGMAYRKELPTVFGRQWSITSSPTQSYVREHHTLLPYVISSVGILLTLFVTHYVGAIHRKSKMIQRLVDERTKELSIANEKLEQVSRTDSLTELANRRYMDAFFVKEWSRAARHQTNLSVIMLDIDHFKAYNDFYGHQAGDECLKVVAQALAGIVGRPGDLVARYGGEEFSIIVAQTENVERIAENARLAVERLKLPHLASSTGEFISISVGVCSVIPSSHFVPNLLIKAADDALYQAKEKGRNRVEFGSLEFTEL
ncbi:diguanylate cyclase domain-containing protein [Psychrobium sp. 1_MG-2023]|uniref:CHASE domain-containing protein n=1 Tax=Psychrobium sp. 1_MG-2023 TaxID=3062624 RepID=UPI000C32B760|nr:diguanylate cyclase [Psychrobium sp. 1_MG-2023]MDP2559539.1 diguanylate cyclase [Psychrobium sp. 1_MG-2023]PKF59378.1 diguanylate cyclase [Alteromonadales bacterium alter-6D02]